MPLVGCSRGPTEHDTVRRMLSKQMRRYSVWGTAPAAGHEQKCRNRFPLSEPGTFTLLDSCQEISKKSFPWTTELEPNEGTNDMNNIKYDNENVLRFVLHDMQVLATFFDLLISYRFTWPDACFLTEADCTLETENPVPLKEVC